MGSPLESDALTGSEIEDGLRQLGLTRGDRLALLSENRLEWFFIDALLYPAQSFSERGSASMEKILTL